MLDRTEKTTAKRSALTQRPNPAPTSPHCSQMLDCPLSPPLTPRRGGGCGSGGCGGLQVRGAGCLACRRLSANELQHVTPAPRGCRCRMAGLGCQAGMGVRGSSWAGLATVGHEPMGRYWMHLGQQTARNDSWLWQNIVLLICSFPRLATLMLFQSSLQPRWQKRRFKAC